MDHEERLELYFTDAHDPRRDELGYEPLWSRVQTPYRLCGYAELARAKILIRRQSVDLYHGKIFKAVRARDGVEVINEYLEAR